MVEVNALDVIIGALFSHQAATDQRLQSCALFSHLLSPTENNVGKRKLYSWGVVALAGGGSKCTSCSGQVRRIWNVFKLTRDWTLTDVAPNFPPSRHPGWWITSVFWSDTVCVLDLSLSTNLGMISFHFFFSLGQLLHCFCQLTLHFCAHFCPLHFSGYFKIINLVSVRLKLSKSMGKIDTLKPTSLSYWGQSSLPGQILYLLCSLCCGTGCSIL